MFPVAFAFFSMGFVFAVIVRAACLGGLAGWAGAVRRIARLLGATRAVVAIASGRIVVSKLPAEERRWFRRLEGQLVVAHGRIESLSDERDEALEEHRLLVHDVRSITMDRDRHHDERQAEARARDVAERKIETIREAAENLAGWDAIVVVKRVLACPRGSADHGLGSCGCEVRA